MGHLTQETTAERAARVKTLNDALIEWVMKVAQGRVGQFSTAVPGLDISVRDERNASERCVYRRSLGVMLSGRKRSIVGNRVYEYGAGDMLYTLVDMPAMWQVVGATKEHPFIAVSIALDEEVLPFLIPYVQEELQAPVYGISLGDLVWDNMPYHTIYKERIQKIGVPVFQAIGNHDHDKAVSDDTEADASFESAFGPTYYSYNIGDCHFIVLDDVLYAGSSSYTADITDEQMAWLEQDLQYVPKDKLIILGVHIPTSRRNRPSTQVENCEELYALLDGYQVRILSGHSHNNYTTTISESIEENTLGSVMGAYWNGKELCNDGSPRGYAVYEIEGLVLQGYGLSARIPDVPLRPG